MEDKFLEVAKQAALEAGKVILKHFGQTLKLSLKNGDKSDFVTKADLEAERLIVKIITANFKDHNLIAEEEKKIDKGSEYTWLIDPLDGTISYSVGLPYFSVSIGLLKNNQPILGVLYDVSFKDLYWAQKGQGAYLNNKQIFVSNQDDLEKAVVDVDTGHRARRQQKIDNYISRMLMQVGYLYSFGPAAGIMGLVSKGNLDAYVAQGWHWDFAGGAMIIKEAGGRITDFEGNEIDWAKQRLSIVASNGLIHDQILEALK